MSTGDLHTLRSSTGDKKNRRRLKPSLPKFQIPLKAHRNARNRVVWSPELHERFVLALRVVEENQCRLFPKAILEVMNVSGLSRENIASHLQKYRLASSPFRPATAPLSRSAASLLSPMDVDAEADFDGDYDERSESTAASPTSLAEPRDESTSGYDSGEEDAAEPAPAGTLAIPAAPMAMYAPPFVFTPPALSYLNTSSGSFPTAAHSVPHVTVPEGLCEPGDESPITSPREATQQGAQYPAKAVQYGVQVGYGMEEPKLFAEELELPQFAAEDEEKWFYVGHATLPQHGLEEVHDFDVGYI